MSLFGKRRAGGDGLGRDVVGGADVIDAPIAQDAAEPAFPASETIVDGTATRSEASRIVDEVSAGKPSRAERRAAAKAEKERLKAEKAGAVVSSDGKVASDGGVIAKLTRRQRKAEEAARQSASDDLRPSNKVMIEFYPGMAKEDAIETARQWALTHMDIPSMCFYYVQKIPDGFAVEVQEGVGKAYLPSVIELAQSRPGRLVIVPMVRRKMSIYYSARTGEFEAQVLPEMQEPPEMPENPSVQASRGQAMTPVMKQYREWLVAGAVAAGIGGLALLSSIGFYAFDPKAKVPPEWRTTDVAQLPIMQWNRLQVDSTDSYVVRLEFQDGQWRIVRQAVGASVDVARPDASGSTAAIVGETPAPGVGDGAPASSVPSGGPIGPSSAPSPSGGVSIPPPGPVPN